MTGFNLSHSGKITIFPFLAKFKIFSFFLGLTLMLLGYKRMIFVIWIATFPFTLQNRVLFNPEGMIGLGVGSYLGLNEIRSPSPMMNFITISYFFNCIIGFIR